MPGIARLGFRKRIGESRLPDIRRDRLNLMIVQPEIRHLRGRPKIRRLLQPYWNPVPVQLQPHVFQVGPNLKDVRLKLNRNWIPVWLKKPTDFRPTTKMPNFRLNDHQIQAISAYIWQSGFTDSLPKHKPGNAAHGKELFEERGCLACHSIGEGDQMQGGVFSANLTRVGEKANYDYLVRWIHNARQRTRPYCPYEKKDIGPEDYAKKGLPYVFDLDHSRCPNDGHELQVQNMTVMPSLRLSPEDAEDIATYLMTQKKQEP